MTAARRGWLRLAVYLVVVGLAAHLIWRIPWHATWAALLGTDPRLLGIAIFVNLLSLLAKGWEWHLLLRPVAPHRWRTAQQATLIGSAVNDLSVSIVGEAERIYFLGQKDRVPLGLAAVSLVWARGVEAVGFAILLLGASFVLELPPVVFLLQVAVGGGVLAMITLAWLSRRHPLPAWAPAPVRAAGSAFAAMGEPRRLPLPIFFALVNWGAQWMTYHLTLLALHLPVPYAASLSALLATNLGGALRVTPANIGVFQTSLLVGLLPFGVAPEHAVAAGVILQGLQVLPVLGIAGSLVGWQELRQGLSRTAPRFESEKELGPREVAARTAHQEASEPIRPRS